MDCKKKKILFNYFLVSFKTSQEMKKCWKSCLFDKIIFRNARVVGIDSSLVTPWDLAVLCFWGQSHQEKDLSVQFFKIPKIFNIYNITK